jgi:hypothetical protein
MLQKNVLNRERWSTREELRLAIVIWIGRTYPACGGNEPSASSPRSSSKQFSRPPMLPEALPAHESTQVGGSPVEWVVVEVGLFPAKPALASLVSEARHPASGTSYDEEAHDPDYQEKDHRWEVPTTA